MTLKQALVNNGSAEDKQEAKELVAEMYERVCDGEDPEEVLLEYGLELDYAMELMLG